LIDIAGVNRPWASQAISTSSPTAFRSAVSCAAEDAVTLDRQHRRGDAGLQRLESALDERLSVLGQLLGRLPRGAVRVQLEPVVTAATEQLVDRQTRNLPLDVPERLLDGAHRREGDGTAAEERLAVHQLPQMLDPRRVLADDVLPILLDRRSDRARVGRQASLPDPAHTFVRLDDDEEPVPRPDVDDERLNRPDLHLTKDLTPVPSTMITPPVSG
jgi:hypothetical protein